MVHSVFSLARSCRWSFVMLVVSVAGLSSVTSFANSSALSFLSIPMCPGTHEISMFALWFSLRNGIAASTNPCDICWLGPGFSSVIASTDDVLSANSMIVDCLLSNSGVSCRKSIAASSPLNSANISASYTSANLPLPLLDPLYSFPVYYPSTPVRFSCSISFIDEPPTETSTIAKLHWQLHAKMKPEWSIEWSRKPIAGRYAISDRIPPSLAGSHTFRTLDQCILGTVTQARTGHGHFGEYYQTHNIQEPTNCPCGAGLQTRKHIVFKCWMHEEHGDVIDEGAPDYQLATLLGTKTDIDALAEFVRKSKAFQKTRATELP